MGTVLSRSETRIPSGGAKGQTFEPSPSGAGPCSSPAGSEAASCACARLRPRAVTLERAEPLPSGCLSVRDPRLALLCCQTPLMASAGYRTDSCQRPWPGPPAPGAAPAHPQLQRSPAAARWLSRSCAPERALFVRERASPDGLQLLRYTHGLCPSPGLGLAPPPHLRALGEHTDPKPPFPSPAPHGFIPSLSSPSLRFSHEVAQPWWPWVTTRHGVWWGHEWAAQGVRPPQRGAGGTCRELPWDNRFCEGPGTH